MKVYRAYFRQYEEIVDVGVFSSKERAEESLNHLYELQSKEDFGWHFTRKQGYVDEFELDDYYTQNLSPVAKLLKDET